jgi:tetratricopeptide (TPR) repeat protein
MFWYPYNFIYSADSGDLLTAVVTDGIPHAPGFPFYYLVNKIFNLLPFGNPAYKSSLVSLLFSILALIYLYKIIQKIKPSTLDKFKSVLFGISTIVIIAFSSSWLIYSGVQEVYTTTVFFINASSYYLLLLYKTNKKNNFSNHFKFFAVITFGIFHHYLIIFSFIAYIYLMWPRKAEVIKLFKKTWKKVLLITVLAFSPYLVFVLKTDNTLIKWQEEGLVGLYKLITRNEYGFFDTNSNGIISIVQRIKNFTFYTRHIYENFNIVFIILIIVGLIFLIKTKKKEVKFILVNFLLYGPLLISYASINTTTSISKAIFERYFLLSFSWLGLLYFFGLSTLWQGLLYLKKYFQSNIAWRMLSYGTVGMIVVAIPLVTSFQNLKEVKAIFTVPIFENHAKEILNIPKKNSILLLQGDLDLFPVQYIRYVKGYRQDVKVLSASRMSFPYYYKAIKSNFPELKTNTDIKMKKENYREFIFTNINNWNIYTNFKIVDDKIKSIQEGILYRLSLKKDKNNPNFEEVNIKIPIYSHIDNLERKLYFYEELKESYSNYLTEIGNYYYKNKKYKKSLDYFKKSYLLNNDSLRVTMLLSLNLNKLNKCGAAERVLLTSYEKEPLKETAYALARIRAACFKDKYGFLYWQEVYKKLE